MAMAGAGGEREARYRELSRELERQAQGLVGRVEAALQKQDTFPEITAVDIINLQERDQRVRGAISPVRTDTGRGTRIDVSLKTKRSPTSGTVAIGKVQCRSTLREWWEKNLVIGSSPSVRPEREQTPNDTATPANETVFSVESRPCCHLTSRGRSDRDGEFLEAFITLSVQDNVLPKSFAKETTNVESVCKFLASKAKLLQEQVDKLQGFIDRKATQCEQHLRATAELEGERLKLIHRAENLRGLSEKHANRALSLAKQLQECEHRYKQCRSIADAAQAELRSASDRCKSAEARRVSLEETVSKLHGQVDRQRAEAEEVRTSLRAHSVTQQQRIAELERHGKRLVRTIHTQERLLDNLRRQRRIGTTEVMLERLEREYSGLLEQKDF